VRARVVINATGAWADGLRGQTGAERKLRPLRGSHLVLPAWRLPLSQAVSLMHPADGRPVFAFPWEGVTLVGTTDVDHDADLTAEAAITKAEFDYLMEALCFQFPQVGLAPTDVIATYAGVRPVIDSGQSDPSKEPREHAVLIDHGMVTVTGGKLTTFRVIAMDALKAVAGLMPAWSAPLDARPVFAAAVDPWSRQMPLPLPAQWREKLAGRYGANLPQLLTFDDAALYERIPGTETLWAELKWAARAEAVAHLEDLLLRRTRLGLQLRHGGAGHLARIRAICQPELGWTNERWDAEAAAYLASWNDHYALPREYA
jgi:glycerol-3-phosphate dehydrogenase